MGKPTPGNWYAMTFETGGTLDQATVCSDHETGGEPTFLGNTREMGIDTGEVPLDQRKANAVLFAASKDLLAALVDARKFGGGWPEWLVDKVDAAIAKANAKDAGRSPTSCWRPISTVPDDDEAWIIVRTSAQSVAPGHVMRCRRGMLSDRPGPNHLRIFADYWMPYVEPEG